MLSIDRTTRPATVRWRTSRQLRRCHAGLCELTLPSGMVLHRCSIFVKDGNPRASPRCTHATRSRRIVATRFRQRVMAPHGLIVYLDRSGHWTKARSQAPQYPALSFRHALYTPG
jgi:hypothetical protein